MSNDYIFYNGELYHHGVKGMRWGVRKDRRNRSAGKTRKKASAKNSIDNLSDEDLRKKINRLQMEQQYSKLKKNPSNGRAIVSKVLTAAVTAVGIAYAKKGLEYAIDSGVPAVLGKIGNTLFSSIDTLALKNLDS